MSETAWCRQRGGKGNSLSRMRRRVKLLKPEAWAQYLYHRRARGADGVFGLEYAVVLSKLAIPGEKEETETDARPETLVVCEHGTLDPEKVNLVTGDCVEEMRKLPAKWFHTIVTSFPYWPARRSNHPEGKPIGIGFEAKWEDYVDNMVCNVGREEKRVLRDDGVMFVMMDDAIALPPLNYAIQTYQRSRNAAKIATQTGFKTQDSTYLRPEGNWLGLPHRYMMAMQNDGWICRDVIIIVKGAQGRKESSETRTRHNYEWCFMFVKRLDYYYDQDETRIPLTSMTPTSLVGSGTYQKPGVIRGTDFRTKSNPLGRVMDAVWHMPHHYIGRHASTFSETFARRCLLLACPPGGRVLDPFGGVGTVALAASKLGIHATSIDLILSIPRKRGSECCHTTPSDRAMT